MTSKCLINEYQEKFTAKYKKEIIKLITEQGKKVSHVDKEIDVS